MDAMISMDQNAATRTACVSTAIAGQFPQYWPKRKNSVWMSSNGDACRTVTAVMKPMSAIPLDPPQT